jgi:excisionase family DNA binding protein
MAATHPDPTYWTRRAPEWLSLQQAANIYGVSVDTLRRRVVTGDLPASRLGRRIIRVRVEDLNHMFRPIPTVRPTWRPGA